MSPLLDLAFRETPKAHGLNFLGGDPTGLLWMSPKRVSDATPGTC